MKKIFLVFFAVGLLFVSALRSYDFIVYFNEASGFFENGGLLSGISLFSVLFLCIALLVISLKKLPDTAEYIYEKNTVMAIVSLICSGGLFYSSALISSEHFYIESYGVSEATVMGISLRLPLLVLTVLFGIYALINSYCSFTGNNLFSNLPFLTLVPVVWAMFFTLFLFMHYSISPLVPENAFVIITSVAASYSFLQYAAIKENLAAKRFKNLGFSALAFTVLSVSYAVSSFIKNYNGIEARSDVPDYVLLLMLFSGLYMLFFVLTMKAEGTEMEKTAHSGGKRFRK